MRALASARPGAARASAGRSPRLEALLHELEDAVERAGVQVREERLLREVGYHTQSGIVRLDGAEILLLDSDLPQESKAELLAEVLATRAGIEIAATLSDDARRALSAAVGELRGRGPEVAASS